MKHHQSVSIWLETENVQHLNVRLCSVQGRDRPWLKHVEDDEAHREEEADATDGHVGDADEVVPAADPGCGGQDKCLRPPEAVRVVVVLDHHRDLIVRHDVCLNSAVKLPERWEGSSSHPDNEVLLLTQLKKKKTEAKSRY